MVDSVLFYYQVCENVPTRAMHMAGAGKLFYVKAVYCLHVSIYPFDFLNRNCGSFVACQSQDCYN